MTTFDGDATISSTAVMARIRELESETENLGCRVVRDSDGETLGTFGDSDEAEAFIEKEDYDPDKVSVAEDEADEDDVEELEELREFERDCRRTFDSYAWDSGMTITNGDEVDADFAEQYFKDNIGSVYDEIESYIDWSRYADDFLDGRDCAELNGNYYYDL